MSTNDNHSVEATSFDDILAMLDNAPTGSFDYGKSSMLSNSQSKTPVNYQPFPSVPFASTAVPLKTLSITSPTPAVSCPQDAERLSPVDQRSDAGKDDGECESDDDESVIYFNSEKEAEEYDRQEAIKLKQLESEFFAPSDNEDDYKENEKKYGVSLKADDPTSIAFFKMISKSYVDRLTKDVLDQVSGNTNPEPESEAGEEIADIEEDKDVPLTDLQRKKIDIASKLIDKELKEFGEPITFAPRKYYQFKESEDLEKKRKASPKSSLTSKAKKPRVRKIKSDMGNQDGSSIKTASEKDDKNENKSKEAKKARKTKKSKTPPAM